MHTDRFVRTRVGEVVSVTVDQVDSHITGRTLVGSALWVACFIVGEVLGEMGFLLSRIKADTPNVPLLGTVVVRNPVHVASWSC